MPFVPVPNSAQAEMRMMMDGQHVENTLWFEFPSAPAASDLTDVQIMLFSWWIDSYKPLVSNAVQLVEVVVTDMSSLTGGQVSFSPPIGEFGGKGGPPLPSNVSLSISFRTALRGRSFRGRNYVVGLAVDDQLDQNSIKPTVMSAWVDAYTELIALASGAGATWIVASRFSGVDGDGHPVPRAAGVTTPITNVVATDNTIDSQRRRLPGRGA